MKTVMVVDDHQDSREAIATFLSDADYRVVQCNDGQAALAHLVGRDDLPDAIVLDMAMPVMSGDELLRVLRHYLRLTRVPIIVVSGVHEDADVTPPVVAFIKKPADPNELVRLVSEVTHRHDD